jgi:hypothetical protein
MVNSDHSYSDRTLAISRDLESLYLSDAWPKAVERRFSTAREAVANLLRELIEMESHDDE